MSKVFITGMLTLLMQTHVDRSALAQGAGEKFGKAIDRGITQLGNELEQGWEEVRRAGDRMGIQARVYTRLHWDKEIQPATIDIDIPKVGTVVLKGSVPSEAAKQKAVRLANDTVGVENVVDRLAVSKITSATPQSSNPTP
jgi:hyperosmotically inducible periplasmic protein